MASKRVSKKASILDPIFKLFLTILEAPGGGRSVKMASKIASKTALALKLGLSTPGSPPGAHFDPLGPRFWSLRELIFEASAASSAAWPEARSPRSAWLTNGGRRCWRSHNQLLDRSTTHEYPLGLDKSIASVTDWRNSPWLRDLLTNWLTR